ncbi:MAG: peptide chain release factor N(5)-glutamine methyltransferase [Melioribacteraceae bacterium]|nr:peptide chain release factor N(5)-glutamine methyltransferase [Melioribacteraceae bacterium]
MLTVLDAIKLSTEYLEKKGVESPRINSELLLAYILKCKRLDLYLSFDRPLQDDEISLYRDYISRRGKREPLQYITGEVEFYGIRLMVNRNVLVPRQETEILVEHIINDYKDREGINILEIGTGSGNIAIALAMNLPRASVTTVDISLEALNVAKNNAGYNHVEDRISFIQGDILSAEFNTGIINYDLIVSNPPYVSCGEMPLLQREITEYEPEIALSDYSDGLSFYRTISEFAGHKLVKGGRIYFEAGIGQYKKVQEILKENGLQNIKIEMDYLNIERVIIAEKK